MRAFRQHLHELTAEWRNAVGRHPRALGAALVIFAVLTAGSLAGVILFYNSLRRGLPGEDAVRHIFEMSEATAMYDAGDRLVFTIYQEQRIEMPLSEMSPHLVLSSVVRVYGDQRVAPDDVDARVTRPCFPLAAALDERPVHDSLFPRHASE